MRPNVLVFAAEVARWLPVDGPVVEIGCRPAEGQEEATGEVRRLFQDRGYVGCDMQDGLGVDQIEDVHALSFADDSVGAVVSFDTLEHVSDPLRALREIHRVLRPGGVVAISSVMFFPIHAHPYDYWRFTPEGFALLLDPFQSRLVIAQGYDLMPETVFGVGVKGPCPSLATHQFPETARLALAWGSGYPVDFGPIRMRVRDLWQITLRESRRAVGRRLRAHKSSPSPGL